MVHSPCFPFRIVITMLSLLRESVSQLSPNRYVGAVFVLSMDIVIWCCLSWMMIWCDMTLITTTTADDIYHYCRLWTTPTDVSWTMFRWFCRVLDEVAVMSFLWCRWWWCLLLPFRPAAFQSSWWWFAVFVRQSSFVCWWISTTPMMGLSSTAPIALWAR